MSKNKRRYIALYRAEIAPVEATLAAIAAERSPSRSHRSSRPPYSHRMSYKYTKSCFDKSTMRVMHHITR